MRASEKVFDVPEERKRGGNVNSEGISNYILKTALKHITRKGNTSFRLYICSNYACYFYFP